MSRAARPVLTRFAIGSLCVVLYVVGGGSLLAHLVSGAATASNATPLAPSPARVVIALSVIDSSRAVTCETSSDRVSSDALIVTEFDLPAVYKELGCQAPPDPS